MLVQHTISIHQQACSDICALLQQLQSISMAEERQGEAHADGLAKLSSLQASAALQQALDSSLEQIDAFSTGAAEMHDAAAEEHPPNAHMTHEVSRLRGVVHLLQKRLQRVSAMQAAMQPLGRFVMA